VAWRGAGLRVARDFGAGLRALERLDEARALLAPARWRVGVRVAMLAGYP
jgi:hypothetical protein